VAISGLIPSTPFPTPPLSTPPVILTASYPVECSTFHSTSASIVLAFFIVTGPVSAVGKRVGSVIERSLDPGSKEGLDSDHILSPISIIYLVQNPDWTVITFWAPLLVRNPDWTVTIFWAPLQSIGSLMSVWCDQPSLILCFHGRPSSPKREVRDSRVRASRVRVTCTWGWWLSRPSNETIEEEWLLHDHTHRSNWRWLDY
jgi:hypothetical protein